MLLHTRPDIKVGGGFVPADNIYPAVAVSRDILAPVELSPAPIARPVEVSVVAEPADKRVASA